MWSCARRTPVGAEVIDMNRRRIRQLEQVVDRTREQLARAEAKRVCASMETRRLHRELMKRTRELDALRTFARTERGKNGARKGTGIDDEASLGSRWRRWFGREP